MEKHWLAMTAAIVTAAVNTLAELGKVFDVSNDELCELIYTALEERRAIAADDVARLLTGDFKRGGEAENADKGPAENADKGGAPETGEGAA